MDNCQLPAALTAITMPQCAVKFDQIIRNLFQRRQPDDAETPLFTGTTIKALATWTPLLAATDDTKVVPSPFFSGLVIPSEGQFEGGGDNSTINGVAIYKGEGPVEVTGQFTGLPSSTKAELKSYTAESESSLGISNLTVYLVNRHGEIICKSDYSGIPIYNFRISSVGSEGYNAHNKTNFSYNLLDGWDDDIIIIKPSFNPLTAL